MTTIQPGSAGPPPGWYTDPTTGSDRYWNGRRWTDHTRGTVAAAPLPPAAGNPDRASTGYVIAAYLFAILIPVVGLVMGIVLMTRNRKNDGAGCIVLSLIIGALWYASLIG